MNRKSAMISSTIRDLPEHRAKVRDACLGEEVFPSMMEHWPAIDADGIKASLEKVDSAEIYVGVFGFRYGYIPDGQAISVTEMEYDRAIARQIPRLIFLMDDKHPVIAADVEKGENSEKLQRFKERLKKERTVAFFNSPERLHTLVAQSLSALPKEQGKLPSVQIEAPPLYDSQFPVFSVPFRAKGKQVIGREMPLNAVRGQLTEGKRTAIGQTASFQGLGGLGKTQLAVEYAYEFRSQYPNGVIWLNADQDIDAQLTELATVAKWVAPEAEHKIKLSTARRRLKSYSNCLIIFDNLEDAKAVREYLPDSGAEPHILVTSRLDQPDFVPVPLDVLDHPTSVQLLIQEAGRNPSDVAEQRAAEEVAELLGGLPLALELAGAFLRHRAIRWDDYVVLLKENLQAALPGKYLSASFTRHESDLHSTLAINEQVFVEEPQLREIMDVLTWSAAAPMGRQLLCDLTNIPEAAVTSALSLGVSLRLIQRTQSDAYALHRLIREVRRDVSWIEGRSEWVKEKCGRLSGWFESVKRDFADVAKFESEVDHLRDWLELARRFSQDDSARLTWLLAYPPFHRARYTDSKGLLEQASQINLEACKPDELLQTHIWNDLSTIYSTLGDFRLANNVAKKALEIRQRLLGEDNRDTAMSHNNVGATLGQLGNHKDSLAHCQRAYEIWSKLNGEQHIDTALALSNIAGAHRGLNEHGKALSIDLKTLEIRRKMFGEYHPDTILSMYSSARCYLSLNSGIDAAAKLTHSALAASHALFGEKNLLTAAGLFQLADILFVQARFNEAALSAEKSLTVRVELFDYKHRDVGRSAIQLSNILVRLGKVNQAFALLDRILQQIPHDSENYTMVRDQRRHLSSTTFRPGFRQPPKRK